MRSAWARGVNYDRDKLKVFTVNPGFILGESKLGEAKLGGDGAETEIDAEFTSIVVNFPTTVEDGLWVHREVETCQLTGTLPTMVDLRGQRIVVRYMTAWAGGTLVYKGTARQAEWTETIEVDAEYKPGNTATKTYRVQLLATSGEEALATTATPSREFTDETIYERFDSWTGLTSGSRFEAADMPANTHNVGWDGDSTVQRLVFTSDPVRPLLDTLREEAKLRNSVFTYRPWDTTGVMLWPANRWLSADEDYDQQSESAALTFTDASFTPSTQVTDEFLTYDQKVSYSTRQVGEDTGMFCNSVRVRLGYYDLLIPPPEPVEYTFGPYRTSDANPNDVAIDLGSMDIDNPAANTYKVARNFVSTLPLKIASAPFTKELSMPMQSVKQLPRGVPVPAMALLTHDGETERVAVLGIQHNITPNRWSVSYTLGPHHLLDRESDLDPGTPQFVSASYSSPTLNATFKVPHLPSDVQIYRRFFWTASGWDTQLTSWDASYSNNFLNSTNPIGDDPGDQVSVALNLASLGVGAGSKTFFVAYSSNPSPGSGVATDVWREGQPLKLGTFVIT